MGMMGGGGDGFSPEWLHALLTLGNTLCPPQGDIKRPNDSGKVSQFAGSR